MTTPDLSAADKKPRPWTGDYVLDHFTLPAEVEQELRADFDTRREAERADSVRDRERRLAASTKPEADKPSDDVLTWTPLFDPDATCSHELGPVVKVISAAEVDAMFAAEKLGARSSEPMDTKRAKAVCRLIASRGEYRLLGTLAEDWQLQLDELDVQFPNFTEVIDYFRALFNLAALHGSERHGAVPELEPILLDGPPGVGKSYFAMTFADMLGVPYTRLDFGSMQTGGELTGSDAMWANSKAGGVFKMLVERDYANPVMLLDEIDKTNPNQVYNPESALLTLLERSTSTTFHDLSLPDLSINASKIIWIATANELRRITPAIVSRFRVFTVGRIPDSSAASFVDKVLGEATAGMLQPGENFHMRASAIEIAKTLSPRILKRTLREAAAYAYLSERTVLYEDDLLKALDGPSNAGRKRFGFG